MARRGVNPVTGMTQSLTAHAGIVPTAV